MSVAGGGPRHAAPVVAVGGALAVLGVAFLPWAHSGEVDRAAFALARTARNLRLADTVPLRALLVAYYLMPLFVAVTWLAAVGGKWGWAGAAAVLSGAIAAAAGAVVLYAPVRAGPGPWASMVAGTTALAGGGWLAWEQQRRSHHAQPRRLRRRR